MVLKNTSLLDKHEFPADAQVAHSNCKASTMHVRELILKDQNRSQLRESLSAGANSESGMLADGEYFSVLRSRVRSRSQ